ncbi:hypothetical protein BJ742DRAFT_774713 [Cladochytrium replicatum]|nr:hypothetical protein BJ742DRAFT_774713 [Cladochytrium replicatum]
MIWLEEDAIKLSASRKRTNWAAKLLQTDCLVGIVFANAKRARPYPLASIVELNCETDFVAPNRLFSQVVFRVGLTAAKIYISNRISQQAGNVLKPMPIEILREASLLTADALDTDSKKQSQKSTNDKITELARKLGENLPLRLTGTYPVNRTMRDHTAVRIAALVLLKASPKEAAVTIVSSGALRRTARQLAPHGVGFDPKSISNNSDAPSLLKLKSLRAAGAEFPAVGRFPDCSKGVGYSCGVKWV